MSELNAKERFMAFSLQDRHSINRIRARMEKMNPEKTVPLNAAMDAFGHEFDNMLVLEKILDNL